MANILQSVLNTIAKNFKDNTSGMLIWTGAIGWGLSSIAQMGAILFNSKISDKERSFLLPQEFYDAVANIALFLCVTNTAKFGVKKLFTTGKFAPQSVRNYLKNYPNLESKIGKLDLNLDLISESHSKFPTKEYNAYKNFGTTAVTVGAGILSTNVLTPIIRNRAASEVQKKYENYTNNKPYSTSYSNKMKI